ncbi:MAG: DUF4440 domain-containing protein [Alphaproteobacteria bacterium]|nr:DUF4440 domain-containing protein [Alphaproteobacteria bacterium]
MDRNATISEIRELELSLHRLDVRTSRERVEQLLADDFTEFGRSGRIYDKRMIVDLLAQETSDTPPAVAEFEARFLSEAIVLVTYRAIRAAEQTLRCSIWRRESAGWRMTFHQGTPIPGA